MDLIFIATGQISLNSPTSIILNAVINPSTIKSSPFFLVLFGIGGIAALATLGGVSVGVVSRAGIDLLGFAAIAATLVLLVGDYIAIFSFLKDLNATMAVLIMAPLIAVFVFTVAEWLRGKD